MSKIKAAKTLLKKATEVFPFVKGKVTGTKKAGELYQKQNHALVEVMLR